MDEINEFIKESDEPPSELLKHLQQEDMYHETSPNRNP